MADAKGNLALYITANASQFTTALAAAEKKFGEFGKKLDSMGKTLSVGLTLPILGFATKAVSEFQDTQKALGQVEAGLRSTGNAAGFTAGELEKMAKSLQGQSIFSDDEILRDVTSQLLTFTNVSGKAFEQAQQAAADLSARLGQDLQSSAIQVGKALNDPLKGLTALGRVGVQFSEDQKEVIKSLVATGDIAGAQQIILNELNTEFGGSAKAALDASGGLVGLRNAFNDTAETVGSLLAPALSKVSEFLKGVLERFQELSPETQKTITVIAGIAAAIGPALIAIGAMTKAFGPLSAALKVLPALIGGISAPITLIVAAVAGLAILIISNWDKIVEYFSSGPGLKLFEGVKVVFEQLYQVVTEIFSAIVEVVSVLWSSFGDEIVGTVTAVFDGVVQVLSFALDVIISTIKFFKNVFSGNWEGAWDAVKEIWMKAMNFLIDFLKNRITAFLGIWDSVFTFFGAADFIDPAINAVNSLADSIKFDIPASTAQAEQSVTDFTASVEKNMKKTVASANEFGTALQAAASPRVDVSQLAPIQSNTDNLQVSPIGSSDQTADGSMSMALPEAKGIDVLAQKTQEQIELNEKAAESYRKLGEQIGATFEQSGETLQDYLKNVGRAVANMIRNVIKAYLAEAVAGYIAKSIGTLGPLGVALAAAAPGVVGGLFDALVPAFAKGGMVTGPTLAMVGDNASGKEAIIPFERMGQFIGQFGGGQQVVVLEHRISGNDLLLVGREAQRNNNTIYGRRFS